MIRFEDLVRNLLDRLRASNAGHFVAPRPQRPFAVALTPKSSPPPGPIPSRLPPDQRLHQAPPATPRSSALDTAERGAPWLRAVEEPYSAPPCRWGFGTGYVPPVPTTAPSTLPPSGRHPTIQSPSSAEEPSDFETRVFRLYD